MNLIAQYPVLQNKVGLILICLVSICTSAYLSAYCVCRKSERSPAWRINSLYIFFKPTENLIFSISQYTMPSIYC